MAKQYGIRIRQNKDMPWTEFCTLVAGLMPDTPLGQIVTIRSEQDPNIIKKFSPEHKKVYNDWRLRRANKKLEDGEKFDNSMKALESWFAREFSVQKGGEGH